MTQPENCQQCKYLQHQIELLQARVAWLHAQWQLTQAGAARVQTFLDDEMSSYTMSSRAAVERAHAMLADVCQQASDANNEYARRVL
ncbi:hypothetical protein Daura_46455 [Dactylosporangium aurantiacum]|uniref:Uncharacterized protein n=1 Tax=Dactylosporangium aurantiacum TaxID=35754 RepID=A0A9Q9MLL2_9ACTN|nr:hypothetical protein [Dactylosporangium aurantiacum]MDG6108141.1 hypothetical protein [Dactylosporangium aurantiacum]UWZ53862.1 hypothetical protein Daura_46455 [Dactylosporangium aurantiacum]